MGSLRGRWDRKSTVAAAPWRSLPALYECGDAPFRLFVDYPRRDRAQRGRHARIRMQGPAGYKGRVRILKKALRVAAIEFGARGRRQSSDGATTRRRFPAIIKRALTSLTLAWTSVIEKRA